MKKTAETQMTEKIRIPFAQRDWSEEALRLLRAVPRDIRLAFFAALAVNVVCYFYEMAQFPLGDHDVGYLSGIPLLSGGRVGRWAAPLLHFFSGHAQIPVWTQLMAICAQIAAGMGAVLLWKRDATVLPLLAGALLVSCMPTVTEFYYFHWSALMYPASQLWMIASLFLSLPAEGSLWEKGRRAKLRFPAAVAAATLGLATYQSALMTWTVVYGGICLMTFLDQEGELSCKDGLKRLLPPLAAFAAGGLLYGLSLRLYPLAGLSLDAYQFSTFSPSAFFQHIPQVMRAAYAHLFLTQPFMGPGLVGLLALVWLAGSLALAARIWRMQRPFALRAALLMLLALMPVAAKAQFFISAYPDFFAFRFAAMSMTFMYAFFMAALFRSERRMLRNAGFVLGLLLVPAMLVNTINEQVYLRHANMHDFAILNRVVARIEALPGFDPEKTYNLVQFGRSKPYIAENYGKYFENASGVTVFYNTVSQVWNPGFELRLLTSYLKLGDRLNEYSGARPDLLRKALVAAEGRGAFPAPDAVTLVDDTLVIIFDQAAVAAARQRLD